MLRRLTAEETKRAAKKPLPKDLRAWFSEIAGISGFLHKKPKGLDKQGREWFKGKTDYDLTRVLYLGLHAPERFPPKLARAIVAWFVKDLAT